MLSLCSLITCAVLYHEYEEVAFTDKQHFRTLSGATGWLVAVVCVHSSRINTIPCSPHVDRRAVLLWCQRQHLYVVMPLESTALLFTGGYLWVKSCNHILPLARDDHQCPFRGLRNDDSEGQGVMIPGQPFSLWRTMEHLFLPSVFTPSLGCDRAGVSGQHMASSD